MGLFWGSGGKESKQEEKEAAKPKEWPPYPTLEHLQEEPETVQLSTAPYDPRHPNTNQTRHCFQNYVNYHRCKRFLSSEGKEAEDEIEKTCFPFKRLYKILCPNAWHEQWDEWVEEERSPFFLEPPAGWDLEKRLSFVRENEERAKTAKSSSIKVTVAEKKAEETGGAVDSKEEIE
jgi:cytochrome c oxidase subunit 6b